MTEIQNFQISNDFKGIFRAKYEANRQEIQNPNGFCKRSAKYRMNMREDTCAYDIQRDECS